ncbi:hypothetical protein H5410_021913 [Solanum commersonii]|uniref:NB-ARC domain-containing protein n=1 Tax=Solanum commersonii TaxID=4109 RepID=A0A9J5ZFM5_SOLCO|nr:hypothetical protein H5410_021913 [Solanum commersonii]
MCNIGKTTLAKKVDDDYICSQFDKHAWVTIFKEYNKRQMLLEVVSTITGSNQEMSLNGGRFRIVKNDIWSTKAWDQMQRTFPNDDNRSQILLTTQLFYIVDYVSCPDFPPHRKSFISLDDNLNFTKISFKNRFASSSTCRTRELSILYYNVEDYPSRLLSLQDFLVKWTQHMINGILWRKI